MGVVPINKIKMDIEGGELEVCSGLTEYTLWSGVQELLMEYHFNIIKDNDHSQFTALTDTLMDNFDTVNFPPHQGRNLWNIIVYARKNA
jgi:hypothetical protein